MIRDADAAGKKIVSWLPPDCREEILRISADINHIVRQFIYGYLSVSLIVALLSFILLKIIGVDSPGLLGVIVGVADLIPYFGPFIGAIPAIIIAFAKGPLTALLAALALGAVQQLESLVISPKIIGSRTGLHPLTVIFVVLAGGYYFGVGGMILSVPLTAALKLLLAFIYSRAVAWRES
jgi:predicted PurR-regulated permease PerM